MSFFRYMFLYRFRDIKQLIQNDKKPPQLIEASLEGKRVLLSGATAGIGLATAHYFAERGAQLVLLNRNRKKSEELERVLKKKYNCDVETILVDFSSLKQVKECAETLWLDPRPLDVLIHNAGVFNTRRCFSPDGLEMVFQVNHLSSFLLNYQLREKLKKENRARIIYVSSEGHRFALGGVHLRDLKWRSHIYTGLKSYGAAKTAQLLTMARFKDFFTGTGVTINAMHPGNVVSAMGENNGRLYRYFKKKLILSSAKDPLISAQALFYLSTAEALSSTSGKFYNLTTEEKPAPHGRDRKRVEPVWKKSLELCGLI